VLWIHTIVAVLLSTMGPHPPAHEVGCFEKLARCGYPSASNTGVPEGTKLRPRGSIRVTTDGATLSRLRVSGTVTIGADDVTVRESVIRAPNGGSGTTAIVLEEGAEDFHLERSEVTGPDARHDGLESAVWNHYGNRGAIASDSYLHGCADCWEGPGRFNNDYIVVNQDYGDSHNEAIYVCGGSVVVKHSTLINRFEQTAAVFGDTSGCGNNNIRIVDSMLAGGGYIVYPQGNSTSPVGSMYIYGNRFARCRTKPKYDASSGGTSCQGGPDSSGVFPNGGYFGIAAYYFFGPGQTWSKNVWDDNLHAVCLNRHC
jgi:hypothetical protein